MRTLTIESQPCTCGSTERDGLERVRFFPRQLLTAEDMITEQDYFRAKLRRHNRYLHGWGVVCGLTVSPAPVTSTPWRIQIDPGYALAPYGDEIYVAQPVFLDLARCAAGDQTDPCDPTSYHRAGAGVGQPLFVAIRYSECFARPVRAMPPGCGCDDTSCEYSRIRDSFELGCIPEGPSKPPVVLICDLLQSKAPVPCPPEPTDPWVVLAQVNPPGSPRTPLNDQSIDNSVRRQLFSTGLLQDQLIRCCCRQSTPTPVRVVSCTPSGTVGQKVAIITVTFNKSIQPDSIKMKGNFFVRIKDTQVPLDGTVSYDETILTARFTPKTAINVTTNFTDYQIIVRGSDPSPVTDVDNLALDGDYLGHFPSGDGKAGGDFIFPFTVGTPG
jgi:hypothetical protein